MNKIKITIRVNLIHLKLNFKKTEKNIVHVHVNSASEITLTALVFLKTKKKH